MQPMMTGKSEAEIRRLQENLRKHRELLSAQLQEIGLEVREQMTRNLSGVSVSWSGGTFQINVVTGNLRRHVRMVTNLFGDPLMVGVFNNAEYAEAIEQGVTGEQRKRALLKKAPRSKEGKRYRRLPKGDLSGFWTVNEDSSLADIKGRPFPAATLEQMQGRITEKMGKAISQILQGKR